MSHRLAIVVPIYKQRLDRLEEFSLDYLLKTQGDRSIVFMAPAGLDNRYYVQRYTNATYAWFEPDYFTSVKGYNRLLLSTDFYERFTQYDYILIHQTDALLLKDNLDDWMAKGYDYIGAPWPMAMVLNLEPNHPFQCEGSRFEAYVGNGGFSLRSVARSIEIIRQAQALHQFWCERQLHEDCFFAFAQVLGEGFRIPPVSEASRFALEVSPRQYYEANHQQLPTGCHAWGKYDFAFWQEVIPKLRQFGVRPTPDGRTEATMPQTQTQTQTLSIFCDGGFGNRLNTLISGLAVARYVGLTAKVYWPRNNWCQASFQQIFTTPLDVSDQSLTDLAGSLSDAIPLLHDTLGADTLKVPFQSAYAFSSLQEFAAKVVATGKDIFYYPALIPPWLPMEQVVAALQTCRYQPLIHDTVVQFVQGAIGGPFYGLHLRRTDLNVGYSDDDVQAIVRSHPQATFFVCSDDPIAEALAAVHPHVHRRAKGAYVGKRNDQGDWMALTADDDGRMYHSNIDRNADSVIDGVIDMLILAHSSIVGFSGSTFQNMARLYGNHAPLVPIAKPAQEIEFPALSTLRRMVQAGALSLADCIGQALALHQQGRKSDAMALERLALEYAQTHHIRDGHVFLLHYNLGAHLLNDGAPYEASLYAEKALALIPNSQEAQTLLATAQQVMHRAH